MKFKEGDYIIYNGKSIGHHGFSSMNNKKTLDTVYKVISTDHKYGTVGSIGIEMREVGVWYLYGVYVNEFDKVGCNGEFEDCPEIGLRGI